MDLSIVIVNWNTRDLLAQCLRSVYDTAGDLALEVFVVDNASSDGSADMVRREFPQVKLIENAENVGFARANNQAIRLSSGRYVLLLNSDAVIMTRAIQAMVSFMDEHDDVGLVGPELLDSSGRSQLSWAAFPTVLSELLGYHSRARKPLRAGANQDLSLTAYEVDWVAGACLLVRMETVKEVGLMDERFFLYSEETDWCHRIRASGWGVVFLPEAKVVHLEGRSSAQLSDEGLLLLYSSKILYARKYFGKLGSIFLKLGLLLRLLVSSWIRPLWGRGKVAISRWRLVKELWHA